MNELVEAIGGKTGYDITLNRLLVFIDCARRKYQDGHAKLGEWINTVIRRIPYDGIAPMLLLESNSFLFRRHTGLGRETAVVGVLILR